MKNEPYGVLQLIDFLLTSHQKWLLVYIRLNWTNVNLKHFIVLMTLLIILQKALAGNFKSILYFDVENSCLKILKLMSHQVHFYLKNVNKKELKLSIILLFLQLFCKIQKCHLQTLL